MARKTLAERFWAKVDRSGGPESCWPWTAGRHRRYGRILVSGENLLAHRVAWELENGPIPDGMNVLHDCPDGDLPACCNPGHLWLGTQADNVADMARKGRGISGPLPYGVMVHGARYVARARVGGKQRYLGTYDTVEEAHQAALRAKREFYASAELPGRADAEDGVRRERVVEVREAA